jgi:hypothetical protein
MLELELMKANCMIKFLEERSEEFEQNRKPSREKQKIQQQKRGVHT